MTSNTSELIVAVREDNSWSRHLSITVPAERVQRTRGRVAEQIARGARLPGFRKGKLPARVIEQRFGPSIDQETIDRLIQETYREALETQGITPISQGRVDEVKYDPRAELTFEVEVEVRPEIEFATLKGFSATRPPVEVGESDVESVLERLRDERSTWAPKAEGDRPDYGDQVLVDILALTSDDVEPHSYRIIIGEQQAIPDVEAAILTLTPGESGEFDVAFPDDFPDEARRSQKQRLRIKLEEAQQKVLPEIDDEFALSIGGFESVDALRERILTDLTEDAVQRSESEVRRQLIDQVLTANPFDAPESMLQRYLDYMVGEPDTEEGERKRKARTDEEKGRIAELREGLRPQALWGLKRTLVVERIAEKEGLRATQDEIDEKVEALAMRNNRSPSEVWIQLEKSGRLEVLEREITEEKVFAFLTSENTVA